MTIINTHEMEVVEENPQTMTYLDLPEDIHFVIWNYTFWVEYHTYNEVYPDKIIDMMSDDCSCDCLDKKTFARYHGFLVKIRNYDMMKLLGTYMYTMTGCQNMGYAQMFSESSLLAFTVMRGIACSLCNNPSPVWRTQDGKVLQDGDLIETLSVRHLSKIRQAKDITTRRVGNANAAYDIGCGFKWKVWETKLPFSGGMGVEEIFYGASFWNIDDGVEGA